MHVQRLSTPWDVVLLQCVGCMCNAERAIFKIVICGTYPQVILRPPSWQSTGGNFSTEALGDTTKMLTCTYRTLQQICAAHIAPCVTTSSLPGCLPVPGACQEGDGVRWEALDTTTSVSTAGSRRTAGSNSIKHIWSLSWGHALSQA